MGKVVLVFVFACFGCLVGLIFYKRYKARKDYFSDFLEFVEILILDVRYRQDGLITVLNEYKTNVKSDFVKSINSYLNGTMDTSKISILSKKENNDTIKFFKSIGKIDSDTQLMVLNGHKEQSIKNSNIAKEKFVKYGSMCIKLGFLLGLGVGIIIV